jgi:hypothetical protein
MIIFVINLIYMPLLGLKAQKVSQHGKMENLIVTN